MNKFIMPDCSLFSVSVCNELKARNGIPQPSRGELQRDIAIESLVLVHHNFAVRLIAQALSDPELGVPIGKLGTALAKMELPSTPYSSSQLKESATDDGIAKWKEWWEANKAQYQ